MSVAVHGRTLNSTTLLILAGVFCSVATARFVVEADSTGRTRRGSGESSSGTRTHSAAGLLEALSCATCHAQVAAARTASGDASFGFYTSPTLDARVGGPDGVSRWCLGCHDGAVATGVGPLGPDIGGDGLENDHPVSFVYDEALAERDGGLRSPSAPSPLGGTIASDLLEDGKLQCTACHDFHSDRPNLLKTERSVTLCLACHDK